MTIRDEILITDETSREELLEIIENLIQMIDESEVRIDTVKRRSVA